MASGGKEGGRGRGRARSYESTAERRISSRPGEARQRSASTRSVLQRANEAKQPARVTSGGASEQDVTPAGAVAMPVAAQQPVARSARTGATSREPLGMGAIRKALPAAPHHFSPVLPQRPTSRGTLGEQILLIANYFTIEMPQGNVYHYDVEVRSSSKRGGTVTVGNTLCLNKRINRLVIQSLFKEYRSKLVNCEPAFDGRRNLYTRKELPFKEHEFSVVIAEQGREQEFNVNVKYATTLNFKALRDVYEARAAHVPQEVIQALDVIMRHGPSVTDTPVGRSIFMLTRGATEYGLDVGHELQFGHYMSVRPAQYKPMLNIDFSALAFYEAINVAEFVHKLFPRSLGRHRNPRSEKLTPSDCKSLSDELKDVMVRVRHSAHPRKYRVAEVTRKSAKELKFQMHDGRLTTVVEYFRRAYPQYRIRYPDYPCIQSGTPERLVYLPLEVCDIVEGQPYRKTLSEAATRNMILHTALAPRERFDQIKTSFRRVVEQSSPYLKEFDIKVSTEPAELTGRILSAPSLLFALNQAQQPKNGVWSLRTSQFLMAMPIHKLALMCVECSLTDDVVHNLIETLRYVGGNLGMSVSTRLPILSQDIEQSQVQQELENLKHKGVIIVIVVLRDKQLYASIKEAAEVKVGILTQCIKKETVVRKCNASLISNLCLKMNAKLGGTNNGLLGREQPAMCNEPIILIGADVTHPAPGDRVHPSIAACVGSTDDVPARYRASVRVQIQQQEAVARVEIIEGLQEMIKELLQAFSEERRCMPSRIIFYRDGVSEGQFNQVLQHELVAIRKAYLQLRPEGSPVPPVTFIVVQKRHHTRFRRAEPTCDVTKDNIPPRPTKSSRDVENRTNPPRPTKSSRDMQQHRTKPPRPPGPSRDEENPPIPNIPAGTVVDTVVTHPIHFDFFLCSHAGTKGTSRPTRYCVLHDDSKFSSDDLQKLSFYLCHTYARCARSVSIPAPVYYAHLAAFRAKGHIASASQIPSRRSASSHSTSSLSTEQYVRAVTVTEQMSRTMYFV